MIGLSFVADDYLMHHGIKGQKWGVRRFQNPDGSLTSAGIKRYGTVKNFKQGLTLKQIQKNRASKEKALREVQKQRTQAAAEKKRNEEAKANAIASGDAAGVYKYRNEMTSKELADAIQRVNMARQLASLQSPPPESLGKKVAKVVGKAALRGAISGATAVGKAAGSAAISLVTAPITAAAKAAKIQEEKAAAIRKGKNKGLAKAAEEEYQKRAEEKYEKKRKKEKAQKAAEDEYKRRAEETFEKKENHKKEYASTTKSSLFSDDGTSTGGILSAALSIGQDKKLKSTVEKGKRYTADWINTKGTDIRVSSIKSRMLDEEYNKIDWPETMAFMTKWNK